MPDPRIQQAFSWSWAGEYGQALAAFDEILAEQPERLDAVTGKGWTLAWQGRYPEAESAFEAALQLSPACEDAHKGLAYSALWSGQTELAGQRFEALLAGQPASGELREALSYVRIREGHLREARSLWRGSRPGPALLGAVQSAPARLETEIWGGWTRYPSHDLAGLRALQVLYAPRPGGAVWFRHDNSLTLDNLSIVQRQGQAYWVGGRVQTGRYLLTRMELGLRRLPQGGLQRAVQGEEVLLLPGGWALKAGGLYGWDSSAVRQSMLFASASIPAGAGWWIEPGVFTSRMTAPGSREVRAVLGGKYHLPRGYEFSGGLLAGRETYAGERAAQQLSGAWLLYQHPLGLYNWLYTLVRIESAAHNRFLTLAMGLRLRLER
ncbi:MAG: hypothetical protein NW241_01075 [Bacteroidia bacterium]|nr:hypothetical protein [Bacteroidia bacterium]